MEPQFKGMETPYYPTYKESVSWLYSLQKFGIKFGLSKTSNLLKTFGNPHIGRRYIHIAGTNGKGSVGAMLESVLMRSGLKVGFYSSPHLVSFTERFRINGELIKKDTAASLIEELKNCIDLREPPTFFEFTTAMALIYFSRNNIDIGIIEVGMGGRLDATNVITPVVSVITTIGLEHQKFLGNTILDIAREKAGIIKERVDLATAVNQPFVIRLFESLCREKTALFWRVGHDARYRRLQSGLLGYYGMSSRYKDLRLGLRGRFQYRNAALTLLTLEILKKRGFSISDKAIRSGLACPAWPGRLEQVSSNPTIILDGAHNISGMRSLAYSITNDFDFQKLILVLGIMDDKDITGMLKIILPYAGRVIYTKPNYYRAADPCYLKDMSRGLGKSGEIYSSLPAAINRARNLADKRDLILITGSLFTVGEAKSYLDPKGYPAEDI
ncbi:MAG TPA: folylpolyglutamate synthase/dihydrofolate synthase family protein [Desulfatiglandales bacterium]|nr:folylpolyglutamate synthase/dihydrofolate synthase family protein [Desulfatiglandales bacterium]